MLTTSAHGDDGVAIGEVDLLDAEGDAEHHWVVVAVRFEVSPSPELACRPELR